MKIGIISDIHSNIDALKIVLEKFENENIEKIICCGDIIGIGPFPNEVTRRLIELGNKLVSVRGNHEDYLLKGFPKLIHNDSREMSKEEKGNHTWNHNKLEKISKDFLENMKAEELIKIDDVKIYVAHYAMDVDGEFKYMIKLPNLEECTQLFKNIDADVFLFGHTHLKDIIHDNNKWYINPGSVGCPRDTNLIFAGILTVNGKNVDYEEINIEYDKARTINAMRNSKAPMSERLIEIFF